MLIVSDTSPITNLIQIGQLGLLRKLFVQVVVPEQVFKELTIYEGQADILQKNNWIALKTVADQDAVSALSVKLDAGEAEAIILAKELGARLLIIDERKGRSEATKQGLEIIGLLGVLVKGKQAGHLEKIQPLLDQLINQVGFRVSPSLYQLILESVQETK
ncbi:MAG: DUF3368 domain-containing protein [Bacteroidota bacterium]